jgi:hypothetical protein
MWLLKIWIQTYLCKLSCEDLIHFEYNLVERRESYGMASTYE